jgi:hypothetical protein
VSIGRLRKIYEDLRLSRAVAKNRPVRTADIWPKSDSELDHELGSHLYSGSLARALRCELNSLFGRISELWRTRLYRRAILLDPLYRTNATPHQRSQAQAACNADMQTVLRRHMWMTQADDRTFLLAWRIGLEWGVRNLDTSLSLLVPSSGTSLWWVNEEAVRRERSLHKFLSKEPDSFATKTTFPSRRIQTRAVRSSGASGSSPKANAQVPKSNSKKLFSPGSANAKRIGSTPEIVASESRYTDSSSTVTRSRVCSSPHFLSTEKASSGFVFGKAHRPRFVPAAKFPHFVKLTIRRARRQLVALQDSKCGQSGPLPLRE